MEPLCQILGITVNELLAGKRIPIFDLIKSHDESHIELMKQLEFEQLKLRLYKLYDIEIKSMEFFENGAGSLTYMVKTDDNKYIVKYPSDNKMNHLDVEVRVCERLLSAQIPACKFITNKKHNMISIDENGRRFTLQTYYEGSTYDYHEAPVYLQSSSAHLLAKIHQTMKNIEDIPVGIGEDFFKNRKIEKMKESYMKTLRQAEENHDQGIIEHLIFNIKIIEKMPRFEFDIHKFSCGNTHGDYMISQLIWDNDKINGVIDWTCVCQHPYIWEIVRSYVIMALECKDGEINIKGLMNYLAEYMKENPLNAYDIKNAGNLFFYFLAVCNFYGQYYDSISKNRNVYLKQANMASKLLVWFNDHLDELNKQLQQFAINNNL